VTSLLISLSLLTVLPHLLFARPGVCYFNLVETVSFIAAKMQPPLRIAMLECDTPLPNTKAKFQDYGGVFEFLLKCGAKALGRPDPESGLHIKKYQIELNPQNYPDLKDIDAILITGSSKWLRLA